MASLFSKLRDLVSATVRGPRQHKKEPEAPTDTQGESAPTPEVTEGAPHREQLPEVTEAALSKQAQKRTATAVTRKEPRVDVHVQAPEADESEALEEERIVDLLKDEES